MLHRIAGEGRRQKSNWEIPVDLLICDIGLPDGSGLELMKTLAEMYKMRGVAISGFGEPTLIDDCKAAGFCEFIQKPTTFEKMKSAIEKCFPPAAEPAANITGN